MLKCWCRGVDRRGIAQGLREVPSVDEAGFNDPESTTA